MKLAVAIGKHAVAFSAPFAGRWTQGAARLNNAERSCALSWCAPFSRRRCILEGIRRLSFIKDSPCRLHGACLERSEISGCSGEGGRRRLRFGADRCRRPALGFVKRDVLGGRKMAHLKWGVRFDGGRVHRIARSQNTGNKKPALRPVFDVSADSSTT